MIAHGALFANALLSATILPGTSEAMMLALVLGGRDPTGLWLAATLGNVTGSTINWWLGRSALRWQERRWFPVRHERLARAQGWFARFGWPLLLLSWLPVVGDAFTLAAGTLRMRLAPFLLLVAIGKGARYALLAGLAA
ncbi:YqaA family protein [Geminicoccaceae bacterium 1502E]|nr:YqaA family protein [Geminicoccaceae bacterium 1502E]